MRSKVSGWYWRAFYAALTVGALVAAIAADGPNWG